MVPKKDCEVKAMLFIFDKAKKRKETIGGEVVGFLFNLQRTEVL